MPSRLHSSSWIATVSRGYLFLLGLGTLIVVSHTERGFWYAASSALLAASAFLWSHPRRGVSASLPFLLPVFVLVLWFAKVHVPQDRLRLAGAATALCFAILLCGIEVRAHGIDRRWTALAALLVLVSFVIDRVFTHRIEVRSLTMQYTLDGTTPWGAPVPRDENGHIPLLLYVSADNGAAFCYDTLSYAPLQKKLSAERPAAVHVEYNRFISFGHVRDHNIRSVDGILFNDGHHDLIETGGGEGGATLVSTDNGKTFVPPACPR